MAQINREHVKQLVKRPAESLVVEIKTWISPAEAAGQSKIIRAAIALRNRGGGYLVIGFEDKTLKQDREGMPADVRAAFHLDVVQALVAKYASEPFEIAVEFVEHQGIEHPVIVVPAGVRTPVAAKADLKDGDAFLIRVDDVYFRTLNSGNIVSSAKVKWKDWNDLVELCFDNREADIGRFLRRHLASADPSALREFAMAIAGKGAVQQSLRAPLDKLMDEGIERFRIVTKERKVNLPRHGSWEVALIIDGQFAEQTDLEAFANVLRASNPSYSGWAIWANTRNFQNPAKRPYVFADAWETLIVPLEPHDSQRIDFMRQQPDGCFYSYCAIYDDIATGERAPTPMTSLDAIVAVVQVAEAIAVGHAIAKALRAEEQTKLEFMFRWTGLTGRQLTSWLFPGRTIHPRTSQQDVVASVVTMPIDTAPSTFAEYVKVAIKPLFEVFEAFAFPGIVVDDLTQRLLERRL